MPSAGLWLTAPILRSQQRLSTEVEAAEAANGNSIDRELLPVFLKDRSNG
jgi:hypothetical protein